MDPVSKPCKTVDGIQCFKALDFFINWIALALKGLILYETNMHIISISGKNFIQMC